MMHKLTLTLLLCMTLALVTNAQSNYYYSDDGKVELTQDVKSFIVHTTTESVLKNQNQVRMSNGISKVEAFAHKKYAIVQAETPDLKANQVISALQLHQDDVTDVVPGYKLADGFTMYPTHQVVFRPQRKSYLPEIMKLLAEFSDNDITEKYGVFRIHVKEVKKVFEVANRLYESGYTAYPHPDFYAPKTHYADPLFGDQFQMNNTGQTIDGVTGVNDMDCNALEAWGVSLGSSSITVAVIDDGMESHEDLNDSGGSSRLIGGFTPANGGNGSTTSSSDHGQACAGIIGASHNNIGVQGVAPLVQMISVNIFYGGETTQDIADGITWAKNNGADVMSNSWGYTSCTANYSNINNALSDAANNGRGGLGSVIVFASGNGYKSCVDFPANNSNVIAVGAFTNQGNRSTYSNYGSALDIMAPSNAVGSQPGAGVRTTDRMGGAGYSSGNYTTTFGGTSAACPVVAGVAALVLGYNPNLTQTEVKNILYTTAIDMGPSGFDNEYANGRVNAFAALNAAGGNPATCTDGIQNGQETGVDCGGPDCPPCQTGCNDNNITLTITLDNYPEETSWNITDGGGSIVASGGTYGSQPDGSTVVEDICLPDACYTFTIFDSYGDGICCSYGNGSYSLNDGGTVLASGGSFGSSEATAFCLGGGGPDLDPPTVPTGLAVANITQTTADVSWNASSDNIGVDGYNVYVDGSLDGSTSGTSYSLSGLSPSTNYTVAVSAYDAAGNESNTTSTNFTTLDPVGGGGSETVFAHYFESGWDGWQDGGSDCYRYRGSRSWEGNYSIRIRDNSGTRSAMTSSSYNLSSYNSVELTFYFYPNSMENGEDFWVRYNDGSGWQTVAAYASGTSFQNGSFYTATIVLDDASYNLSSNAQFRFQCDASANADQIYIDEVSLVGNFPGGSAMLSSTNSIKALPTLIQALPPLNEEGLLITPNPTRDFLNILSDDRIEEISLHAIDGRVLMRKEVSSGSEQLDLTKLPAGVYMISITTEEETTTQRVVKQ